MFTSGISKFCSNISLKGYINKPFNFTLNNSYQAAKCNNNILITRNFTKNCKNILKVYSGEYNGVLNLLKRSGLKDINHLNRSISTTPRYNQEPNKDPKKPKDEEEDKKIPSLLAKAFLWMLSAYMLIVFISLLFPSSNQPEIIRYVSWNEFVHQMLAKGEVEEIVVRPDVEIVTIILHAGAVIKGKKVEHRTFHMNIVDINKFEEKLRNAEIQLGIRADQQGIPIVYERSSDSAGRLLASIIAVALVIAIMSRGKGMRAPISMDTFTQMGRAKFTLVDSLTGQGKGVHFADVAGLHEAKLEIMEFVDYLKRPEHYRSLGAKVPKGALLLGPPGCGKTLLAKAVATEANVPFLSMNGSEFIEMIGGLGAARVRDLFKEGRKRSPCIIYIDEIDAIGRKRSSGSGNFDGSSGEGEQTLNQLLVEMDGIASKEGVLMLASTNRSDVLDQALLRPGRFDRHILIDLPNLSERKEIFKQHLKVIHLEKSPDEYCTRLAYLTPGFSGADIANVCNEAALHAARDKKQIVEGSDLEYAVERVVGGTEKRSSAMSPNEKKTVAYHESGHALIGWLLKHTDALLKVTIVPRTNLALGFAQYTPQDQYLFTKEELFDKMCMALGGRVAEALVFNKITTGAQNDLEKVTKMAYAQIKQYGMNETIGLVSFADENPRESRRPYSKLLAAQMDDEARKLVAKAYYTTEEIMRTNRSKLELIAENLLKKETLNYDDVELLIGSPPHGKKKLIEPFAFEQSIKQAGGSQPDSTEPEPQSPKKQVPPANDFKELSG